jgi:hypothetical protein
MLVVGIWKKMQKFKKEKKTGDYRFLKKSGSSCRIFGM